MKGSRVTTHHLGPNEPQAKIGSGFMGRRAKPARAKKRTIEPRTIGYPSNAEEVKTFRIKQYQYEQATGDTTGRGLLTQGDVDRILAARAKRARKTYG